MGVKIAVIGGGSTYTPELVDGFMARRDRLVVDELVLHDIDADRLDVVGGLARRILARQGWSGRLATTVDRAAAIEGAAFVVVQLRVGGQAARMIDETLPLRFGCVGQETTGPGGFAKALRTVPVVLEIAEDVGRRAAPGAWTVDFTNPVGIVTQALLDAGHRAVGLCNVAITLGHLVARLLDVDADQVALEHVGLNHLTWVRAATVAGVDRLPGLLERSADVLGDELHMPGALLRVLHTIPSYYLRYYYATADVIAEQLAHPSRAEEVMAIERTLMAMYRDPALDRKPELLEQRGGAYYSEAAARLIASLHADTGDIQVVNVSNGGALPGLPPDAVVEVPARIGRDGAHPLPLAPLAPELLGLVQHAKAYEMLAVDAAVHGDRATALRALLANPLVGRFDVATALLDAILEANRPYLPRFA